jgi:predicted acetyltransferase
MKILITSVAKSEKEILGNLLQKYLFESSEYDGSEVNDLGLYEYPYFENYWTEKNRWAYLIKVNGKLAGLIMINNHPEVEQKTDYSLAEFFVLPKYRCQGVGTGAAKCIFGHFQGRWQLKYHPHNLVAKNFWLQTVKKYAKGKYQLVTGEPTTKYHDGTSSEVLIFTT